MKKRKEFKITQDKVDKAVKLFLSKGGKINRTNLGHEARDGRTTIAETENFLVPYTPIASYRLSSLSGWNCRDFAG